jgi:hypothetical protein
MAVDYTLALSIFFITLSIPFIIVGDLMLQAYDRKYDQCRIILITADDSYSFLCGNNMYNLSNSIGRYKNGTCWNHQTDDLVDCPMWIVHMSTAFISIFSVVLVLNSVICCAHYYWWICMIREINQIHVQPPPQLSIPPSSQPVSDLERQNVPHRSIPIITCNIKERQQMHIGINDKDETVIIFEPSL